MYFPAGHSNVAIEFDADPGANDPFSTWAGSLTTTRSSRTREMSLLDCSSCFRIEPATTSFWERRMSELKAKLLRFCLYNK